NVISITDGQIYLEGDLFYAGIRPAVNAGLSVSRVGGAAQTKAMKTVAGKLRLELAQFRELAAFAQFGADLDKATRQQLERGQRIQEVLKQPQYEPMPLAKQVCILFAVGNGYLDDVPVAQVQGFEAALHRFMETAHPEIHQTIEGEKTISEATQQALRSAIADFKSMGAY
ncbi:MAG: F0F1 ATP synthase subunit alpha, partial [Chloroflexi bacterium]|nr:F0F1 ATP synthase subunit alpha [Chloroflexota bacterium]